MTRGRVQPGIATWREAVDLAWRWMTEHRYNRFKLVFKDNAWEVRGWRWKPPKIEYRKIPKEVTA